MLESVQASEGDPTCPRVDQVGPFRVVRQLGRGSSGVIELARHVETGETVALKRIAEPRAEAIAGLRREIYALRQLSHPGVVRIVADGLTPTGPWYAMESLAPLPWMVGLCERRPTAAELDQRQAAVLRAAGQLAETLDYIHRAGIVHGDVKPANILARTNGQTVLVDFGLSWQQRRAPSRAALDDIVPLGGTAHYIAPERISGEPIDARTDLYAFGCILYEWLTGAPPFASADGGEVLLGHLTASVRPPSEWIAAIPPALEQLILALLAKSPRDRVGHAVDVLAVFAELGIVSRAAAMPARATQLYPPNVAGRDETLAEIATAVDALTRGSGGHIVIQGESGIGKTHLVAEAARRCRDQVRVVTATCSRLGSDPHSTDAAALHAFQPLLRALADHCVGGDDGTSARILGDDAAELASYEPALAPFARAGTPLRRAAEFGSAARDRLFSTLRRVLARYVAESPTVFILDDLQWADELSLAFLQSLTRQWFAATRLLVLTTIRSEEIAADALPAVAGAATRTFTLGGLDTSTLGTVVADMLAVREMPQSVVDLLARQSAGNPFYIGEVLRTALEVGLLVRVPGPRPGIDAAADFAPDALRSLALPQTLHGLVARRIDGLSAAGRAVAEAASILGRSSAIERIHAVTELVETEVFSGLSELLARQIMETPAPGVVSFVHDQLAEVAYQGLGPEQRRIGHRRAARSFEEDRETAPAGRSAVLAHHWRRAEAYPQELRYRLAAAPEAFDATAFVEARRHWQRALDLADTGTGLEGHEVAHAERADWESWLARSEFALGNLDQACEHAGRTMLRLGLRLPRSRPGWVLLCIREVLVQMGHLLGAIRSVRSGAARRTALAHAARSGALLTHRYYYLDDTPAFLASALLAVNRAERAGVETEVPRAYLPLALITRMLGMERLYRRYFALAQLGGEALLDRNERAYTLTAESVAHATFGRFDAAHEPAQKAFELIRSDETSFVRELVVVMQGHLAFYGGRIVEAMGWYAQVEEMARRRRHPQAIPWGLFSQARCLHALGRFDEALPRIDEARSMLAARPELQSETYLYGLLASTLWHLGRPAEALARADEALERMRRAGAVGFTADEGYALALRVYLRAWEAGDATVAPRVRALMRLSRQFMRMVPAARPHLLLRVGEYEERRGRRRAARLAYQESVAHAADFRMPRHAMLAHLALAASASNEAESAHHHAHADACCPPDLRPQFANCRARDW